MLATANVTTVWNTGMFNVFTMLRIKIRSKDLTENWNKHVERTHNNKVAMQAKAKKLTPIGTRRSSKCGRNSEHPRQKR